MMKFLPQNIEEDIYIEVAMFLKQNNINIFLAFTIIDNKFILIYIFYRNVISK